MTHSGGITIRELLRDASTRLSGIDAGNPRLEAEYMLAQAMGIERPVLLGSDPGVSIDPETAARYAVLLARRLAREPLQYVLGTVPFAGLDLVIGPGALIPRSETETLVELTAAALREGGLSAPEPDGRRARVLVDVGTGSGAILLALLSRLSGWRGIGTDCSPAALGWARRNTARAVGADAPRVMFLRGDLLSAIGTATADAVVSNPPYISSAEIPGLVPEIREHEPPEALLGGGDGLDLFRRLTPEVARVLRPGGLFAVELAPDQPDRAEGMLGASGAFQAIRIFHDLAGRKRGLIAQRV